MAKAILNGILNLLFGVVGLLGSIIIVPLQAILINFFPDIAQFSASALTFLRDDVFPVLQWLVRLVINTMALNENLYLFIISELWLYFALAISVRVLMLIYRLILFLRGNNI